MPIKTTTWMNMLMGNSKPHISFIECLIIIVQTHFFEKWGLGIICGIKEYCGNITQHQQINWNFSKAGKYKKQVELSRATLEFSFTSLNNIYGQNISVNKNVVKANIGLEKTWVLKYFLPKKLFDPYEVICQKKVWV